MKMVSLKGQSEEEILRYINELLKEKDELERKHNELIMQKNALQTKNDNLKKEIELLKKQMIEEKATKCFANSPYMLIMPRDENPILLHQDDGILKLFHLNPMDYSSTIQLG